MNDTTRFDTTRLDEEVERELAAYASARLSPDRFAKTRMRAFVVEHAREQAAIAARPKVPSFFALRLSVRGLAAVGLVAVLAIAGGTATAFAASPGGPLYGVRIQIETALLPASGAARTDAQANLINERAEELTDAIDNGNAAGADAAGDAYGNQVDQAVDNATGSTGPSAADIAAQRADLLTLQAAFQRQLAHLQGIVKPSDPSAANLQKLITKTQAALDDVNAKLASLPNP